MLAAIQGTGRLAYDLIARGMVYRLALSAPLLRTLGSWARSLGVPRPRHDRSGLGRWAAVPGMRPGFQVRITPGSRSTAQWTPKRWTGP